MLKNNDYKCFKVGFVEKSNWRHLSNTTIGKVGLVDVLGSISRELKYKQSLLLVFSVRTDH